MAKKTIATNPGNQGPSGDDLINAAGNMDSPSGNPGSESQTGDTANGEDPAPGNMEIPNTANLDSTDPAAQNIAAGNVADPTTIQDPAPGNLQPLNQPDPAADIQPQPGASLPAPNTIPLPGPELTEAERIFGAGYVSPMDLPAPNADKPIQDPAAGDAPLYVGDPKDADAATLHTQREAKYGPDYVVASRGKNETTVFTALAWNLMRGDKGGWKQQTEVPSEIRELRKSKK